MSLHLLEIVFGTPTRQINVVFERLHLVIGLAVAYSNS